MSTNTSIEEIARQMASVGHDTVPEVSTSGGGGMFLEVLKQNPGKWYSTHEFRQVFTQLNIPTKNLATRMGNLKKNPAIKVEKRGRTNYYSFSS